MAGGTLSDHLYKLQRKSNDCPPLTWKQRLNICIGAGRGLDYLHTGHGIIHRDVKSSNILLDENFIAKVSDFGLAKQENRSTSESHISTKVKGTKGIMWETSIDFVLPEDKQILTKWARENISNGKVDDIVDSSLRGEISESSLRAFVEVAERCLLDEPKKRPTMAQVVLQLEFSLEQQKANNLLRQLTMTSTDVQNLTPPGKEQANSKVVNAELPSGRIATTYKPPRLWAWDAIWNRFKPSKKKELLLSELCKANIELAKFDWSKVAAATNQFSSSQLVGQGRYGPVYKAILPSGQAVAVKRPSSSSILILKEFNTEIFFLHNIMHRNIIKLLGYCIHREEKLLVYEFMENKSLDTFIDEGQSHLIQWPVRFNIIMGIARGLSYLHQDSGMRIVHRDIKTSSILLDIEMNPKVSDFAFARTLPDNQSELKTTQVVGTHGYMSPESARYGKFSFKSDVYSFGITVLEVVSGRRHNQHTPDQVPFVLLDYAWKLWNEGKPLDLVDESLAGAFAVEEALRCIQVGLLCIQDEPNHRPEMYSVIKMLEGEELVVEPQKPPPPASLLHGDATFMTQSQETGEEVFEPNIKLAKFDWNTIVTVTRGFSSSNKVGEGAFGPVYKGVLPTGQVVAVKRRSPYSNLFEEFKNEILWLPKLQHRNIIKLLGYCIHRDQEYLLVYEFMEYTSVFNYPGDAQQRRLLQWPVRFNIIMGIARGLLYLHQDSGLRIIHTSIKRGNILLDTEMNPKISDFDAATTLAEHKTQTKVSRIFGTFGYLPPEYALHGLLSFKSDVYSFGVTVLEIVNGSRVYSCFEPNAEEPRGLVEYAWTLWTEGKAAELVDGLLGGAFPVEEAIRCIQVGLLCTEEDPNHRPEMHSVLKMLEGEELIAEPQNPMASSNLWP
ncbi:Cysteine-rich receptor-like protein kinase [Sesamum angolense]|uniref:non-specific serine/threonine protein kinase n=1 Tax=Sesamum angolense TaxID=2727404 RepID=A0AAE1WHF6_9LAMI|nr:Cysteine-rich receptor-like protein kinase [Sesamum angolense]